MLYVPLVECTYGWGQTLRLYRDCLDINQNRYLLSDLMYVHPAYRRSFGKPSLRLDLRFRQQIIVLRGIPALQPAQQIVSYLQQAYAANMAGAWPGQRISPANAVPTTQTDVRLSEQFFQAPTAPLVMPPALPLRQKSPSSGPSHVDHAQFSSEHDPEIEQLSRSLNNENWPLVKVPVHLLPMESAYYSTTATWCGEQLNPPDPYLYAVKDQGLLILTNLRLIYQGRRSQLILSYDHLLQVSLQRDVLSLLVEHWSKLVLFEVPRPLECDIYLTHILRRFKQMSLAAQQHKQTEATTPPLTMQPAKSSEQGILETPFNHHQSQMEWLSHLEGP